MRKRLFYLILSLCFISLPVYGGFFDNIFKQITGSESGSQGLSEDTIISGLKEALSVSTQNAVGTVSKDNGFFSNPAIKILIPEKIRKVTDVLRQFGFEETVNAFEQSMNKAVETAAPQATSIFTDAIKQMSFEDAKAILNGGDTAATDYFSAKTSDQLFSTFKPIVASSMDQAEVTKQYKAIEKKYTSMVPLGNLTPFELDDYVTRKGLDGLFYMMAQEEKKIRNDPVGRTTELLKTVFGQK